MTSKEKRKYQNWAIGAVAGIIIASFVPSVINVVDNFRNQLGV